jgi:hypothetical protein
MQIIFTVVTIKYITTLFNADEYINYINFNLYLGLLSLIFVAPVGTIFNRNSIKWKKSSYLDFVLLIFIAYLFIITIISFVLINFALINWLNLFVINNLCILTGLLYFLGMNYVNTVLSIYNIMGDKKRYIKYSILLYILLTILPIVSNSYIDPSIWVWLLSQSLVYIGLTIIFVVSHYNININYSAVKKIIITTADNIAPVIITIVLSWILLQGIRFEIIYFNSNKFEIALAIACYSIISGIYSAFEGLFHNSLLPTYYKLNDRGRSNWAWIWFSKSLIELYLIILSVIILLSTYIPKIFLGEQFWGNSKFIIYAALFECARVIMNLLFYKFHIEQKYFKFILIQILIIFVNLAIYCVLYFTNMDLKYIFIILPITLIPVIAVYTHGKYDKNYIKIVIIDVLLVLIHANFSNYNDTFEQKIFTGILLMYFFIRTLKYKNILALRAK